MRVCVLLRVSVGGIWFDWSALALRGDCQKERVG